MSNDSMKSDLNCIAVIGMSCRMAGASSVGEFWANLAAGRESIRDLGEAQLREAGVSVEAAANERYVRRTSSLPGVEVFDARFFDFTPREATITAPSQRMLLMCAHEAFEDAGYDPRNGNPNVGVFAGVNRCDDWQRRLYELADTESGEFAKQLQLYIANDLDYAATRISYKFDLKGPSLNVSTACSTSLVAIHQACRALLSYECDMALAGGASVVLPQDAGYLHEPGGIQSHDGRCRAFDAGADGTIFGNGAGVVLLKRLDEALADRDHIHALIRGTAINNDGAAKVGFTAPSVQGQSKVILTALALAGVDPSDIGYVEAHGTGTSLGDPIEIEALTRAYRTRTRRKRYCAIGSVKTNIGHLGAAAGVAGFIKTVLALKHRQIPANLHYQTPNPEIDFDNSPFVVNTELKPWATSGQPRLAGLSSFGVGGTNAHAILQEAPSQPPTSSSRPHQLLTLSAASPTALQAQVRRLVDALRAEPGLDLADVAYTLSTGRSMLDYRAAIVAATRDEAIAKLSALSVSLDGTGPSQPTVKLALMFPGQGSQHPNMTLGLYQSEPVFRDVVDRCAGLLEASLKRDIRNLLYPRPGREVEAEAALQRTENAQPALFVTGYATAMLLESWGVQPDATIGHSLGEYVCACLAGVFSLEDALRLVAERGRLMQTIAPGRMLAVAASEQDIQPLLGDCSLAAVNGPQWCVVSGPLDAMDAFETRAPSAGRPLHTSHAFHSSTADPVLEGFHAAVRSVTLRTPTRRFISNLSGDWIRDSEAMNPAYWVRQLRGTVRFHAGITTLLREGRTVLLEAGAGQALTALAKSFSLPDADLVIAACCRNSKQDAGADLSVLLQALGRAWTAGRPIDWKAFYAGERRARVSLPTYPFEGQRYWLERAPRRTRAVQASASAAPLEEAAEAPATATALAAGKPASALAQRLARTAPDARQALMEAFVGERVRELLGMAQAADGGTALVELGLSSLMAIELRSELNAALQADHVSIIQLLDENTNVRTLAAHVLDAISAVPAPAVDAAVPSKQPQQEAAPVAQPALFSPPERQTFGMSEASEFGSAVKSIAPDLDSQFLPFPLTDIQQAYWIGRHNAGSGGNVATYAYIEMEIRDLDVACYEAALNAMVQRHPMLRMVVQQDGQQRFLPEVPAYRIPVEDLSTLGPEEAEARLMETRARMSHQVLDLTIWPLFQLRISKITPHRYRLHYGFDFMIVDALSLLVFFRDMFLLYVGEQDRLAPLQLSYRDYVLAEKASRGSEQFQRSRQYWLDRVPLLAAAPSLPITCDPSVIAAPRYVRRDFELDRDTWSKLKAQACTFKVTPSVLIATAYAEVLAQWCASPRFTLNLTLFNRPRLHPQMNDLIGDFTSSVLLEVDMARVEAFETCTRNIQSRLMQDLEHLHFSGVETLRALNSQMGGYQSVVMPIVLTSALGLDQHAESRLAGLAASKLQVFEEMMDLGHTISQTSQVWLDHVVREKNGALLCNWDALEEIFPPGMLDEMFCAYYDRLIQLASRGEAAWRSLRPTALPDEQQRARDRVNATQGPVCEDLLQTLFERQARKTPDALAVVHGDIRLTYRDLLVLATHLGQSLRAQGARPNELVAVVMDKGWEQIVAVFGILFSGGAYMPVDPALPAERVRQLLLQGEVRIALTQTRLLERIDWPEAVRAQAIDHQQIDKHRGDEPVALTSVQDPGDIAYVLFTSGSTGVPKGVMIDHRSAANTVLDINQRFGITPADRAIAINALNFDLSVYDVFGLLSAGGALIMPLAERLLDASHWSELVVAERVTFWNTVPAIVQLYVEELEAQGVRGRQPLQATEALRLVFMSGDWIPVSLPDRIRAVLPAAQPISLGGPTETTVWSIFYPIGRVDPDWKSIPYGKPLGNRTHYVLHADLTDCPDWVPGDLYIGGRVGLSKGYWRDEEKTDKVFIRHPMTGEPIYRTGDLGRFLPDGNIEFIGRSDHQVKVQGHRIELGEIEHALMQCEGVSDALVMAVSDSAGDAQRSSQRLVAYVVERENADVDASTTAPDPTQAWRDALRARLPYYMVPASFVRLKSFPLSTNGKVDRKALALRGSTDAQALEQLESTPPRDALETAVHAAWLSVLEIAEAGIRDNLFELGGDSLIATKIIVELTRTLGLNLPVHKVFSDPTIEGMAAQYRALQTGSAIEAPAGGLATAEQVFGNFRAVAAQLVRDAAQDLPIVSEQSGTADIANPKAILLTGASGFLGAHVLHELLQRTTATVFCLVRGKDRAECMRRIDDNLARHGFDPAPHRDRIQALPGDLARPELGLAAGEHAQVCANVDVIYHLGATVNFVRTYADMKGANVDSARSIIAMASTGKRKAIVYVSSKFVCFRLDKHGVTILQQEGRIARPDGLFSAYSQGKWVAEKLFERAGDAGIPVAIVRPGQISASAQGRLHLPDDPFHQLIDLFRGLGSRPHEGEWSDGVIDVVPVDYCAAAIAAIGLRADSYGRHFHLVNPQPMSMDDFFSTLATLSGRPVAHARSFEDWADDCLTAVRQLDDKVSSSVLDKFFLATEHGRYIKGMSVDARLCQENVRTALVGSGIICPAVDVDLWRRYLQVHPDNATRTGDDARRAADLEGQRQTVFVADASEFGSAVKRIEPDLDSQFLPFPLTDIQQAYWIGRHNAGSGGNVATYAYIETEIRDLDVARYEAALNAMVQRHPMLRMVVQQDGQQRFLPEVPAYRIPVDDLSPLEPQEAEARLMATRARMSHQVLDPTMWPLFQLRISKTTPGRHRLHYGFDFMILDVLSLLVFFRDMFLLYIGEQDRLAPLQLSYRDYVLAEKASRGSEEFQRSRQYWLDRVPLLAAAPSLPMTCDPSAIAAPRYVRRDFELDPDTWSRLKAQARAFKVTPSVLIATAYAEVLAQWCAAPRFTLNLTLFNRPRLHPQMNDLIGNFTSTVLLEVDMARVEAFETCARNIQSRLMQDLEHRHFSGVETLRALNSQMGGYQSVVMPIVLTSALGLDQHAGSRLAGLDEAKLQVFEEMMTLGHTISQASQVWLNHVVREKNGALLCNWDALEEIFPPRMLDEMFCAYYDRLIQLSSEGEAAWRSLRPTALPDEQRRVRDSVNATQAPVCEDLLQTLFERQACKTPDALAVVNGDVRLTYRELLVLSTHLGLSLREQGVRPNELVAVVMDKGWEQIVAVFSILFSGAAYMPVDPALPAERVRQLLTQGEVQLALTQTRLLERIDWPEAVRAQAIDHQQIDKHRGDEPVALTPAQDAGDLAYVLFTSGSTGVPKGVMIDHRSAASTLLDINQRFGVTSADRAIAISALNFDLSVYDVFGLLSAGGAVVMPLAERLLDASHWSELVLAERVTFWNTVPALVQLYVEELEAHGARRQRPPQAAEALRLVFMSGDWVPVSLPDRIRAMLPAAQPISLGGATESTVWSIFYPIGRVDPDWKSIPYGKPLGNRTHHVLHADLTDCPDWVSGDLYIGGRIGLSKGYWRDEEQTDKVFIRHPVTGEPIYRTGDLGRFLPDGNIEFIGRSDHQVKVQGHRIELGEIEHVLMQCEGVGDALVMAVSDSAGDAQRGSQRLVAYVVERENAGDDAAIADLMAAGGAPDPTQAWRDALRARLPYYMVPTRFVRLKSFPLTANGKVDRKALTLSATADAQAPGQRELALPRDALETAVHAAWLSVLEIAEAGIRDNLFELGGDSLMATKITAELTRTLGFNLPLHKVFANPTIEGMAAQLRASKTGALQTDGAPAGEIEAVPAAAPATAEQVFGEFRAVAAQLVRDAAQDLPIVSEQSGTADIANPKAILLTGASGFLGAHVLHELLQRTTATVFCLVRGKDRDECMRRIDDNLARHGFDPASHRDRIQAVPGDLTRPKLGLAAGEHAEVCANVDVIYHLGAEVNLARTYDALKTANVCSARSIIALAATGKLKAIVYVSSKYVCFRLDEHGVDIVRQEGPIARPDGLFIGYAQSKWVAEKLFERAGDAGIPVAILRPGQISASTHGRLHVLNDTFHQFVDLFRGLGSRPHEGEWPEGVMDIVPVDYCAAAIAAIGLRPDSYGRHFHLVNPQPMSMEDFFSTLAQLSERPVSHARSFEDWAKDCLAAIRRLDNQASAFVMEKFFVASEHGRYIKALSINPRMSQENVSAALAGSGITCPVVTVDLWRRYLQARPDNAAQTDDEAQRAADMPA